MKKTVNVRPIFRPFTGLWVHLWLYTRPSTREIPSPRRYPTGESCRGLYETRQTVRRRRKKGRILVTSLPSQFLGVTTVVDHLPLSSRWERFSTRTDRQNMGLVQFMYTSSLPFKLLKILFLDF